MDTPTILCVDDELVVLKAMRNELLEAFGNSYTVEICESGNEVIELIDELVQEQISIPLVIVDYLLPDISGKELLITIDAKLPNARKIMLTGANDTHEVAKAIESVQLYSYIKKPWENISFTLTAKGALESFQQEQNIKRKNAELEELNTSLEKRVKKRTQRLTDLVHLRDKILSIVTHDIRTPLASLQSSLLLIDRKMVSQEEGNQLLSEISTKMTSTLTLLENLIHWAGQQTGGLKREVITFSIEKLIRELIVMLQPIANDKSIHITVTSEDFEVKANRQQIHLVLRNLISNAIKFTNVQGSIKISTQPAKKFLSVSITDNGIGIPEPMLASLFEPTKIKSRAGTASETGTGLGLLLCQEFVEMNGGTIRVESQEGKGSTFTFTIPLSI